MIVEREKERKDEMSGLDLSSFGYYTIYIEPCVNWSQTPLHMTYLASAIYFPLPYRPTHTFKCLCCVYLYDRQIDQ